MKPLRVLYLHMIGPFGGSSRSLFEVVRAFPAGAVQAHFLTQRGTATPFFAQLGEVEEVWGMARLDHTRAGHYRGLRWLVALRELAYLPVTLAGLLRARRRFGEVDVVHVNDITGGIVLWLARRIFAAPVLLHVRAVVNEDRTLARTRWLHRLLEKQAACVVAIDETVRASLPSNLAVQVIHNTFAPARAAGSDPAFEVRLGQLRPGSFKVGFVGNLLRVKGILDLLEATRLLRSRGVDVEVLIVGDDARDSRGLRARILRTLSLAQDVRAEAEAFLRRHDLQDCVHLLGFTREIALAYRKMDVLCFPSHLDAPGRPVFEAAFFGVPSIVALREPRADTLVHDVTGLAVAAHAPQALAEAIERLARDPAARQRMGEAARRLAERNFDAQHNAGRLLALYERIRPEGATHGP
ncbi:MAG: glycosyltransferase family 4 protein [Rubrivivax sp.]|nr:glycosyltransferase family 4 protein [Rubrivivax sp.]